MISNEQRAHDIAVAMLPKRINDSASELSVVIEYEKLYNEYLQLLKLSDEEREKLVQKESDNYIPVYH